MTDKDAKTRRRVDMSPEAIDRRLRDVGQLYRLGMALREARPLSETAVPSSGGRVAPLGTDGPSIDR